MRIRDTFLALVTTAAFASTALAQEAPPPPPSAPLRATPAQNELAEAPPSTELHSPGMVAGGTVLSVLGVVSAVVGVAAIANVATRENYGNPTANLSGVFGGVFLGGGVLLLGGGIPLIVVGAKEVPVDGAAPVAQAELRVGAGSAAFSMAF